MTQEVTSLLRDNLSRDEAERESLLVQLSQEAETEQTRAEERAGEEHQSDIYRLLLSQSLSHLLIVALSLCI